MTRKPIMKTNAIETVTVLVAATLTVLVLFSPLLDFEPYYTVALAIVFVGIFVGATIALGIDDLRKTLYEISEYQHQSRLEAVDRDWANRAGGR